MYLKKQILDSFGDIGLYLSDKALYLFATSQFHPKGAESRLKRFIRIRANFVRELKALNKEIRRLEYK